MSGTAVRVAKPLRFEDQGPLHVVVVECPWCHQEHEHVAPRDPMPGAELERMPRCNGRFRMIRIPLAEPKLVGAAS